MGNSFRFIAVLAEATGLHGQGLQRYRGLARQIVGWYSDGDFDIIFA